MKRWLLPLLVLAACGDVSHPPYLVLDGAAADIPGKVGQGGTSAGGAGATDAGATGGAGAAPPPDAGSGGLGGAAGFGGFGGFGGFSGNTSLPDAGSDAGFGVDATF